MFNHMDDEAGIWHCMGFHKSVMSRLLDKHVSYFDGFCTWMYKTAAKLHQVPINDMKVAVQYTIIRRLAGLVHSEDTINYESC